MSPQPNVPRRAHLNAHDAKASRLSRDGRLPWFDATRGPVAQDFRALFYPLLAAILCQYGTLVVHALFLWCAGTPVADTIPATICLGQLVIGVALALGVGFPIMAGQCFGAHDERHISDAVHTSMALALVVGLVATVAGVLNVERLLRLFGTPELAMADARSFAYAFVGAMPLPVIFNVGCGLQRAVGNVRSVARNSAIVCATTVALDAALIPYLHLGACGAAFSSIGAFLLGCAFTLHELRGAPRSWRLHLSRIRIVAPLAATMLAHALPLIVQSTTLVLVDRAVLAYVASFGPQMTEAWKVALRIESPILLVTMALATATVTFSAQNFGAGNYRRMREGLHVALRISVLLAGGIGVLLCLLARSIAVATIKDASTIVLAGIIVLATMPFHVLCSCTDDIAGTVRGTGEGMLPTLIILLGTCALRIAWLTFAVPARHSIIATFFAYPLCGAVALALMVPYYRHGRWLARTEARADAYLRQKRRRKRGQRG